MEVDLKKKSFTDNSYDRDFVKRFLGGPGFAIYYLIREKSYKNDPLTENNPLIFINGLLTGTSYPCSGFYSVSARSPLTNIYGEGLSGGFFAAELRKTLNGIIFKNNSDSPVYLIIEDDHFELKDAFDLWGLTTDKTIQSDAYIKRLAYEKTITSDSYILDTNLDIIQSDSYILRTYGATLDSDAFILYGDYESIFSDAHIKYLGYDGTIQSDAFIIDEYEDTIQSDAWVLRTELDTIQSDSYILATSSPTIDSDAFIFRSERLSAIKDEF